MMRAKRLLVATVLLAIAVVVNATGPARADGIGTVTVVARCMSQTTGIALGGDGHLWFTNRGNDTIGRITSTGDVTIFAGVGISAPGGIAAGPDGNLWFTNRGNDTIGRITPTGAVTSYARAGISSPEAITAGPDGNMWFTNDSSIAKIAPAGDVTIYMDPAIHSPAGIAVGPDGNLWFTDSSSVGTITPSGVVTSYPDATISRPRGIVTGPDGNLWFTNEGKNSIGRITPAGTISTFTGPAVEIPMAITSGPDGNLWFTNRFGTIGGITPTGATSGYPGSGTDAGKSRDDLSGIVAGPDGNLWFTNGNVNSLVGRITTSGVVTRFRGKGIDVSLGMARGPDGNIWFTNYANSSIGKITPDGVVTNYTDPGRIVGPVGITAGPDGNVWFTNYDGASIGRITPGGTVTEFEDWDVVRAPLGITSGPGGELWFTNTGLGWIGRISTSGVFSRVADTPSFGSPSGSWPTSIAAGSDGNIWYTDAYAQAVGRVSPAGEVTLMYQAGSGRPDSIIAGPDGNLWFVNTSTHSVLRLTPAGDAGLFFGSEIVDPVAVAAGPDGNVWYLDTGRVGRITPNGVIDGFPAPDLGVPYMPPSLAAGPNGKLWFADPNRNQIGTIVAADPGNQFWFHSVDTMRLLDSRPSTQVGPYSTPWTAGTSRDLTVAGVAGVPATAAAVALNVTVTDTTEPAWLTIWASGTPRSLASSLNWAAGQTIANAVTAAVGADGNVSVYVPRGEADVVVDVVGYYDRAAGGGLITLDAPSRRIDTRPDGPQLGPYSTPWGPDVARGVKVAGEGGVPADVDAVVLNVTVTDTSAPSFLTVWPSDSPRPLTSSLNWSAGQTIANAVTVGVAPDGTIDLFNADGDADVIIDVVGCFRSGSGHPFHPLAPARIQDSRPSGPAVGAYSSPWDPASTRTVAVTGGAIPAHASAVLLNVTATDTTAISHLTGWPSARTRPLASTLNWGSGDVIANAVTARTGNAGSIDLYNNQGRVDVVADAVGWYG